MWSTWTEKAKEALDKTADVFETAGEAITQAATKTPSNDNQLTAATEDEKSFKNDVESAEKEVAKISLQGNSAFTNLTSPVIPSIDKGKMMDIWSSVIQTTKRTAEETRKITMDAVETSKSNLERQFLFKKGFYKRDTKLPLDVEALRDAEVVYITDRIITMSHPATASKVIPAITAERKLAAVGHLLDRRHDGRYLCWNLSEVDYDVSILNDQVLTFSFPGSPSPPLGLLLKLLVSIENWMKADKRNVAVVHCLTGKGRTSTILACFLSWMREAGFGDVNEALVYIAQCKQIEPNELTIPSQRRYASYFHNMLDGVKPSQTPLTLKRIIMSEAPKFAKGPQKENVQVQVEKQDGKNSEIHEQQLMGCAPYLQIFKAGNLIHTSAASLHVQQSEEELPFVQVNDGTVPFNIDRIIQGDVLIRCRHLTFKKKRVSMFRAAFHTGYVPPNVLRLTKTELDGACADTRYSDDFFLDLIFEKVDSDALLEYEHEETEIKDKARNNNDDDRGTNENKKGPIVKASNFDCMLQGDSSRFWDVIASKKKEHAKQSSNVDQFWGPTVGRRRGESSTRKHLEGKIETANNPTKERTQFETFSIGNELDFLPVTDNNRIIEKEAPQKRERDSLMDALNALDEDESPTSDDTEEIVFDIGNSSAEKVTEITKPVFNDEDIAITDNKKQTSEINIDDETSKNENSTTSAEISSQASQQEETISQDDEDMDALLASADEDFGDLDLTDFDDDDDDLEDLENMLKA